MPDGDIAVVGDLLAPVDVDAFLDLKAEQIRAVTTGAVVEIGQRLIEAKDRAGHGRFLAWLKIEFEWSDKSAENYMNVARRFSNSKVLSNLPITREALYLLAGPTVPHEARDAAIERAEVGDRITKAEAQRLVDEAKAGERGAIEEKLGLLNAQIAGLQSAVANAARDANAQTERLARHAAKELAKLQADRDRLQMERDGARETARKLLAEPPIPAAKSKLDSTKSFRSMCVLQGIEALHKELRIPATDVVGAHFETCDLSTEPPAQRLQPAMRQAREISAWLADFLTECERR